MNIDYDAFEGIEDEPELSPVEVRQQLFTAARLGFARIDKEFVQRDDYDPETNSRGSVLADFVSGRKTRALDLLLTIHALSPILEGTPLPVSTWASLLSTDENLCTTRAARAALRSLKEMQLLDYSGPAVQPVITLKRENGNDQLWQPRREGGRGFFTIPFEYWLTGTIHDLSLPAKVMLLILLKETQDPNGPRTFTMPVANAQKWYGISERTAERGYLELARRDLIVQRVQKKADPRHPAHRREVHHRALTGHYSTSNRERLRHTARQAVLGSQPKTQA